MKNNFQEQFAALSRQEKRLMNYTIGLLRGLVCLIQYFGRCSAFVKIVNYTRRIVLQKPCVSQSRPSIPLSAIL